MAGWRRQARQLQQELCRELTPLPAGVAGGGSRPGCVGGAALAAGAGVAVRADRSPRVAAPIRCCWAWLCWRAVSPARCCSSGGGATAVAAAWSRPSAQVGNGVGRCGSLASPAVLWQWRGAPAHGAFQGHGAAPGGQRAGAHHHARRHRPRPQEPDHPPASPARRWPVPEPADLQRSEADLDALERITAQFLLFAGGVDARAGRVLVPLEQLLAELSAAIDPRELQLDLEPLQRWCSPRRCAGPWATCSITPSAMASRPCGWCCAAALPDGEGFRIAVWDCGAGIAARRSGPGLDALPTAGSRPRRPGHCGLGLAIAARVAAAHGGGLEAGAASRGLPWCCRAARCLLLCERGLSWIWSSIRAAAVRLGSDPLLSMGVFPAQVFPCPPISVPGPPWPPCWC